MDKKIFICLILSHTRKTLLCQYYYIQFYSYQSYLGKIFLPAQVKFFDLPRLHFFT